jgi:YVTN family beta-propeller protein
MTPRILLPALGMAAALALAAPALRADAGLLLVANKADKTLSVVDRAAGSQLAAVPEDGETGHEVAASPDGARAFVPIYGSAGVGQKGTDGSLMRVVDLRTRAVVATVDFGRGVRPHCAVFGPRNGLLYVTTELENAVTIVDPATLKIVGTIPTGHPQSHMLAISPDGRRGYTANVSSGTVSVLDLEANTLLTSIPVATVVQRISVSPDGARAFTADQTKLRIVVIDTATNAVSGSIPLPGVGFGTTPTPDGRSLLVVLQGLDMMAQADLATMRVTRTIDLPKTPQEIRVTPDGSLAYVSCGPSAQVAVVDLRDWKVVRLIATGHQTDGMALVRPD